MTLRSVPVRWLAVSTVAESIGDSVTRSLVPIVAVSLLGAGVGFVGVLNSLGLAAFLLLSLPIGAFVDRSGAPLRVMRAATMTRLTAALMGVGAWGAGWLSGSPGLMILVLLVVGVGVADVFYTAAQGLVVPRIVDPEHLRPAYGRVQAAAQSGGAAGPIMLSGVLLVVAAPVGWCLAAGGYALSLVAQRPISLRAAPMETPVRASLWALARRGFSLVWAKPLLARITVANALNNAAVMGANTLLPVIALRTLGLAPAVVAALGAAGALSGILGATVAARVTQRLGLRRTRLAAAGVLSFGAVLVTASVVGVAPWPGLVSLAVQSASAGAATAIAAVAGSDVPAKLLPPEHLGAGMGAQRALVLGVMPVAALIMGLVASAFGLLAGALLWLGVATAAVLPCLRLKDPPA